MPAPVERKREMAVGVGIVDGGGDAVDVVT